jgi:hypothetical protein
MRPAARRSPATGGRLIKHGEPGDPHMESTPNPKKAHVAPLFPTDAAGEYYKQLLPNTEVTLPGSTCATCTPQTLAPAHTWTPQALALLVERLGGAVIATHSQSGIMGHHAVRILKEKGKLNLVKALITIEGGCSLAQSGLTAADFDAIPYLVVKGDYANVSQQCQENVDAFTKRRAGKQGSAKADYFKLDDMRMLGTTHMMMLDSSNLQIADLMLDWAGRHVTKAATR